MFTSKINNIKKINILFSVQQLAVLLAGSSRTGFASISHKYAEPHSGSGQTHTPVCESVLFLCPSGSELDINHSRHPKCNLENNSDTKHPGQTEECVSVSNTAEAGVTMVRTKQKG